MDDGKKSLLWLSPKQIADDLYAATRDWKGLRVTCKLITANRNWTPSEMPVRAEEIVKKLQEPDNQEKVGKKRKNRKK